MSDFLPSVSPEGENVEVERVGEPVSLQRHHSARTKDRKQALDILFSCDLRASSVNDCVDTFVFDTGVPLRAYSRQIVEGVAESRDEIDGLIAQSLDGWTLSRLPRIDRCLAEIAVWELLHTDVPAGAVISEATELADELSTDGSRQFLNGVLGTIARKLKH